MKKLYTFSLCFALLVLAACSDNLFGSSSSGSGDDVKSLRIDAENAFRKGNYKKSYEICEMIVKKEPASSFGYFGMAKASLWWHEINPLSIFSLIKPEESECPFMGEDVKVRNNYLQAMKKIVPVLSELDRRDSLTFLYEFHVHARENKGWDTIIDGQSLNERLSEFRKTFCDNAPGNDCRDTTSGGKKREPFPLSDREYKSSYFGGILLLSSFSKWILNFLDINKDGCLTRNIGEPGKDNPGDPIKNASEWEKWGCKKNDDGNFGYDLPILLKCIKDEEGNMGVTIDSKQILEELQKELYDYYDNVRDCKKDCNNIKIPAEVENLNETIDNFGGDFKEVEDVLNGLGLAGSDDPEIDQSSIKDEINKYMAYASFYKVGTHIDEDGDGCIDEDLLDGQDNDGDGLPNANARLASVDPNQPEYYGVNAVNNSMWGNNPYRDNENWEYNKPVRKSPPVKICNSPDCSTYSELWGDEETGQATVIGFTQKKYPDGSTYWTTRDMDLKLAIAQDTVCPPQYNLEFRKQKIGGCWPYYDECKFVKYWLKRELAHPTEQKKRVHLSCEKYKNKECP